MIEMILLTSRKWGHRAYQCYYSCEQIHDKIIVYESERVYVCVCARMCVNMHAKLTRKYLFMDMEVREQFQVSFIRSLPAWFFWQHLSLIQSQNIYWGIVGTSTLLTDQTFNPLLGDSRQVLYHWTTHPALCFCSLFLSFWDKISQSCSGWP